jgi:hypothetical protein
MGDTLPQDQIDAYATQLVRMGLQDKCDTSNPAEALFGAEMAQVKTDMANFTQSGILDEKTRASFEGALAVIQTEMNSAGQICEAAEVLSQNVGTHQKPAGIETGPR